MNGADLTMTYIGGPTALVEWAGLRLLTDPTFDPAGTDYRTAIYTLKKRAGPAISVEALGRVDAVLLSHDQHYDNLDHAGRELLTRAGRVLTTTAGAERLGGRAAGLAPWQELELPAPAGGALRVIATPARHGPADRERGPVIGFVLSFSGAPDECVYVSGDTVWFEGVEEVARRFKVALAVLFMGAALVPEVGPAHLTMTAQEGVLAARAFRGAAIAPVHYAGWEHYSESRAEIQRAVDAAGLHERLCWLEPGAPRRFRLRG